jgi:hypothetical protein
MKKIIFIILTIAVAFNFVACESPTQGKTQKAINNPAAANQSGAEPKSMKAQVQENFTSQNMVLLKQAHGIFEQVWSAIFAQTDSENAETNIKILSDQKSVFSEMLKSMRTVVNENGVAVKKPMKNNNCTDLELKLEVVIDRKTQQPTLYLVTTDCNQKVNATVALIKKVDQQKVLWSFNPSFFKDGVGERLMQLGKSKMINCEVVIENQKILKSISCINLGQDFESLPYEFNTFKFNKSSSKPELIKKQEPVVSVKLARYQKNNFYEIDPTFQRESKWANESTIVINELVVSKNEIKDLNKEEKIEENKEKIEENQNTAQKNDAHTETKETDMNQDSQNQQQNSQNQKTKLNPSQNSPMLSPNEMESQNEIYEPQQ